MTTPVIVLLGTRRVGKSSLCLQISQGSIPSLYVPTYEDFYHVMVPVGGEVTSVDIYDIADETEDSEGLIDSNGILQSANAFIFVFDVRKPKTLSYYTKVIDRLSSLDLLSVPRLIAGNFQGSEDVKVTADMVKDIAPDIDYVQVDASSHSSTLTLFRLAASLAHPPPIHTPQVHLRSFASLGRAITAFSSKLATHRNPREKVLSEDPETSYFHDIAVIASNEYDVSLLGARKTGKSTLAHYWYLGEGSSSLRTDTTLEDMYYVNHSVDGVGCVIRLYDMAYPMTETHEMEKSRASVITKCDGYVFTYNASDESTLLHAESIQSELDIFQSIGKPVVVIGTHLQDEKKVSLDHVHMAFPGVYAHELDLQNLQESNLALQSLIRILRASDVAKQKSKSRKKLQKKRHVKKKQAQKVLSWAEAIADVSVFQTNGPRISDIVHMALRRSQEESISHPSPMMVLESEVSFVLGSMEAEKWIHTLALSEVMIETLDTYLREKNLVQVWIHQAIDLENDLIRDILLDRLSKLIDVIRKYNEAKKVVEAYEKQVGFINGD